MKRLLLLLSLTISCSLLTSCEKETILAINVSALSFENSGGKQTVDIVANKVWSATSNQGWCKVSPFSGDGSDNSYFTLSVFCEANTTYDERSCTITVVCEELTSTITVTQAEGKGLIVSQTKYDLSFEAQTIVVNVQANSQYSVDVDADCRDWISFVGTKGLIESTVSLAIEKNEFNDRTGNVTIKSGGLQIVITINQEAGYVVFEDEDFESYCINEFDINNDRKISYDEARLITFIDIQYAYDDIESLKGIEYMPNLESLICRGRSSKLQNLNVSKNFVLKELDCGCNQLTALDISNNTALTQLVCSENQLNTLDVSRNTALTKLSCWSNRLTALDVSNNTALTQLVCSENQLNTLDVSRNTALTDLYCQWNQLTNLDVSNNTALTQLNCSQNQLIALDVSRNTALTELSCESNRLTALDVSNNTALRVLYCDCNELTTLDVGKNTVLSILSCAGNQLTVLDVNNNTALTYLYCACNQLTTLDVSNNQALFTLGCAGNPNLTEIWLKTGQTIQHIDYDSSITTIKYK